MQLISILLSIFALILLCCALRFIVSWHRAHRNNSIVTILREGIGHIGISAIVEYPTTAAPLLALLEEEYPHYEAIIIVDMQQPQSPFTSLVQQFGLVKVNHTHLKGVRALYRSRHRAYRRVVMMDLPLSYRRYAGACGKEVASYDTLLYLQGECLIARYAITYCANMVARHHACPNILLKSIVGASVRLERGDMSNMEVVTRITADNILAWRNESFLPLIALLLTPTAMVVAAHFADMPALSIVAVAVSLTAMLLLYLSARLITEKSLLSTFNTILINFYQYIVRKVKKFDYLYKERWWSNRVLLPLPIKRFVSRATNNKKPL